MRVLGFSSSVWNKSSIQVATLATLALALSACSYKTPPATTPVPDDQVFEKSFFRKADGSAKTFMCGWAAISDIGGYGNQIYKAAPMPACNIQFQITKDWLIGRQVNPSLPPADWASVIKIRIREHFTLEPAKDKYDRPTNELIRNTSRDEELARPQMALDFTSIVMDDFAYELLYSGTKIEVVKDVEQALHKGNSFLGFTIAASSPTWGRYDQAEFRLNFLEFQSESVRTFPPRLYHDDNSNHFGAIWGMGKRIEGLNPVQFSARWDFRPEALPHEICLNGFEGHEMARKVAVDSLNEWNRALVAAKIIPAGVDAFKLSSRTFPSGFDLRCSSFTYVGDSRISEHSPLGIAQMQADVNNGKILWGAMTVYGGALETYIEYYRGAGRAMAPARVTGPDANLVGNPFSLLGMPEPSMLPSNSGQMNAQKHSELRALIQRIQGSMIPKYLDGLKASGVNVSPLQGILYTRSSFDAAQALKDNPAELAKAMGVTTDKFKAISKQLGNFLSSIEKTAPSAGGADSIDQYILASYEHLADASSRMTQSSVKFDRDQITKLLFGSTSLRQESVVNQSRLGSAWRQMTPQQRQQAAMDQAKSEFAARESLRRFDADRTIADLVADFSGAPAEISGRSIDEIVRVVLRETILHEWGHVLGLAHNFKENIMPAPGTVPAKYEAALAKERDKPYHQNTTTVMGYPHSFQMLVRDYNEINVGPQDELVLRYIYRNEYPTWNGKDDDFLFVQVPGDGRIPSSKADLGNGRKVSYFPSCTDYMEFFGIDPYCNRWDRGYDAKSIVDGLIADFENNWIKKHTNLVDTGSDPYFSTYRLWTRSLTTFSRLRKFYDHMRYTYRAEIQKIADQDQDNLYSFAQCSSGMQSNDSVRKVFQSTKPEFADLCEVNAKIVDSFGKYLRDPGPDFTTFDNEQMAAVVSNYGNDYYGSWSRFDGTWKELGMSPMKMAALFTLTTPTPYWNWGPYIIPVEKYGRSGENTKYTYASLYPYQFTNAVSEGVKANLKLNAIDGINPQMGRVALFMGWFLGETFQSFESTNDYHLFDKTYMRTIRDQTKFIFDPYDPFIPVVVEAVRSTDTTQDPDRVKTFTAMAYIWGQRPIQLGEAYMLPRGKVVLNASPQLFILPISDLFFVDDNIGVVWGIRVQYSKDRYSNIGEMGLKHQLYLQYQRVIDSCIEEAGLREYFKKGNPNFKGFTIIPGIAGNDNKFQMFVDSVQTEFNEYWKVADSGKRNICTKALDDVGAIVTQSLVMSNFWLPQITEYIGH